MLLQVHAIGSGTMKSADRWGDKKLAFRKREGYIAAYRAFFELGSYGNWNKFRAKDFHLRNRLARTFYARHWPLSDGKDHPEFEGLVKEPEAWSMMGSPEKITIKTPNKTAKTKINSPPAKKIKVEDETTLVSSAVSFTDTTKLVLDPKTGEFVECIQIED